MRGHISIDVPVDEVLDELSDDDLLEEVKRRKASLLKSKLEELRLDDWKALRAAVADNDAAAVLEIVAPLVEPDHAATRLAQYAKLQRDPTTGRPVIQ